MHCNKRNGTLSQDRHVQGDTDRKQPVWQGQHDEDRDREGISTQALVRHVEVCPHTGGHPHPGRPDPIQPRIMAVGTEQRQPSLPRRRAKPIGSTHGTGRVRRDTARGEHTRRGRTDKGQGADDMQRESWVVPELHGQGKPETGMPLYGGTETSVDRMVDEGTGLHRQLQPDFCKRRTDYQRERQGRDND